MAQSTVTASGPVSVDEAWARYAAPARWSSWAPQIRGVTYGPPRLEKGAAGIVHGPLGLRVHFTVLEVAPPSWAWRVRVGPVSLTLHHDLAPAGAFNQETGSARGAGAQTDSGHPAVGVQDSHPGCLASVTMTGPRPVLLAYAPVAQVALRRLTR